MSALSVRSVTLVLGAWGAVANAQSALQLDSNGAVQFAHNAVMNTGTTATIEYWARGTLGTTVGVLGYDRFQDSAEHKVLALREDGAIAYLYAGSPWQSGWFGGPLNAPPGSFPVDGQWHHVAFVRRADGRWELYVDGQSILAMGPGTGFGNGCWLTCNIINGTPPTTIAGGGSGWQIDELRVSSIERYSSLFAPATRFTSDSATVMLLHFDEGFGDQVGDAGIATQAGTVTGSYLWIAGLPGCAPSGVSYCTSGTTTHGCTPSMSGIGTPSASASSGFDVIASGVEGQRMGLIFYGLSPAAVAWAINSTSYVCVAPPQQRTGAHNSSGTSGSCDGVIAIDFNAFMAANPTALGSPFLTGDTFYAQAWFRDPGAPKGTNLSDGLRFTLCN